MKNTLELYELIETEIKNIEYPRNPKNLYKPIEYVLSIGGKRIRPILLLLSHQLFKEDISDSVKPSIAIEIFHNFTLLHDDIMDNASLRRGKETVHQKWNNNTAILSGDTMLVQSFKILSCVKLEYLSRVITVFNKAAEEVCEGQQLDMDFENRDDVSISQYLKMIEYKTAVLLAASLKIGAIIGGASKEDCLNMYEFGLNMGIVFQLKDDLLDTYGDPQSFGKKLGGDILSNKKTFLMLKSLQISKEKLNHNLKDLYSSNEEDKLVEVIEIFNKLNIQKHTSDLITFYYTKAMKHLDLVKSKNKKPLMNFVKQLEDRIS